MISATPLSKLQREFMATPHYSGRQLRTVISEHFKVSEGKLESLAISPNRGTGWITEILLTSLERHIPDLTPERIKPSVLAIDPQLYSKINGKIPPEAFYLFGFIMGEKTDSGINPLIKFGASSAGYRVLQNNPTVN